MSKKRPTTAPKSSGKVYAFHDVTSLSTKTILELNSEGDEKILGNSISDFKTLRELGRGSYGVVYHVISLKDSCEYVVKKIILRNMKEKKQKEAVKEVHILRKIHHPNIIKYYNSFLENQSLHIVMEYANGGDLSGAIKRRKEKGEFYSENEIWRMAYELVSAVDYLHSKKIIHRDIKTLNIFLTKDGKTKIGDLGVSKVLNESNAIQATRVGTPLYLAPEMVKHQPYNKKVDVWALGCVLYHACALESPFSGDNLITLGFNIVYREPRPIPSFYSKHLWSFINKFIIKDHVSRPKISKIMADLNGDERKVKTASEVKRNESIVIHNKTEFNALDDQPKVQETSFKSPQNFKRESIQLHSRENSGNIFAEKKENFKLLGPAIGSPKKSKPDSMKSSILSNQNDESKVEGNQKFQMKSNHNTPRANYENISNNKLKEESSEDEILHIDEEVEDDKDDIDYSQLKDLRKTRPMTADMLHKFKVRPFSSKVKGPIIKPTPSLAQQKIKEISIPSNSQLKFRDSKFEDLRPKSALTKMEFFQPKEEKKEEIENLKTVKSQFLNKNPSNSMFNPSLIEYAMVRLPAYSVNNLNAGTFLRNNVDLYSANFYR